ncbi:ABC transporter substrate-binding protein [Streptococcus pneumoniae]|nr:ABC transporter substrate-binding protein [Streptococcus pneumoniae]
MNILKCNHHLILTIIVQQIPANKKALEQAKDELKQFANSVKPQELDWEFIGKNIDSWIEKAQLEFVEQ